MKKKPGPRPRDVRERFEEYVRHDPISDCWIWDGARYGQGYGKFGVAGKTKRAHRVSYQIYNGTIAETDLVLHRCDTPACVNPKHLFIGTHADNVNDKCSKGRQTRGITNGAAKLTEAQVRQIRAACGTHEEIAQSFGISRPHVTDLKAGKHWRHINESR